MVIFLTAVQLVLVFIFVIESRVLVFFVDLVLDFLLVLVLESLIVVLEH